MEWCSRIKYLLANLSQAPLSMAPVDVVSSLQGDLHSSLTSTLEPEKPPQASTCHRRCSPLLLPSQNASVTEDDLDSTVLRFPPEASQLLSPTHPQDVDSSRCFAIEPLPCHLGEPDFALHSSTYMRMSATGPPSYAEVEEELRRKRRGAENENAAEVRVPFFRKRKIRCSVF